MTRSLSRAGPCGGYGYNAAGDRKTGEGRSITWDALGKARHISAYGHGFGLTYGPDGGLVDNTGPDGGRYLGAWLKKTDGSHWSARIRVNGRVIAVVRNAGGRVSTHYLLRNHLGSTAAVASGGGTLQRRISYGAWGNFVNPATGRGSVASGTIAGYTTVTYTGHELIAGADLTNMGARLYDPKSGLFMSPDPTVAHPSDPMDLNQYAYVGDNPMSGVDLWGLSEDFTVKYPPIHVTGSYVSCPSGWVGQHEPDCYPFTAFLSGGGPGGGGYGGPGGGRGGGGLTAKQLKTMRNKAYCQLAHDVAKAMLSQLAQNPATVNATAMTVYGEVRNSGAGASKTYAAVAWVFINRVAATSLGQAESGFSGYGNARISFTSGQVPSGADLSALNDIISTVAGIYSGSVADPTGGMNFEGNLNGDGKVPAYFTNHVASGSLNPGPVTQRGQSTETHTYCGVL